MEKATALIADDEADAIEVLTNLLRDSGRVGDIHSICDSHKVECSIRKFNPDVLFLDIEMPGVNGLTILENLREYNQDLPVVYVTAYEKYIPEAIKLHVFSYLLKPIDRHELNELLDKLAAGRKTELTSLNQKKIKLPVRDGYIYLHPEEIFLLEAEGNYTRIIATDQREFISSYNLGRLVQRLPGSSFFRINRKNFLNSKYLSQINKRDLYCTACLDDKEFKFEVSKAFITNFNKETL